MRSPIRLLILSAFMAIALSAAAGTPKINCDEINNLSVGEFIAYFNPDNIEEYNCYKSNWLPYSNKRHQVIERLDEIMADALDLRYNRLKNRYFKQIYANDYYYTSLASQTELNKIASDRNTRKEVKINIDHFVNDVSRIMLEVLQLDYNKQNNDDVEANIFSLNEQRSIRLIHHQYKIMMNLELLAEVPVSIQKRNLAMLEARLSTIENGRYSNYTSYSSESAKYKDIDVCSPNDIFGNFGDDNQDREQTGGLEITLSTNKFKSRWVNLGWLFKSHQKPSEGVMSYQSFRFGMEFFTPYPRYRNNFALADTLHYYDRPFSSYAYVSRSKYRLWPKGLVRHNGEFQFGQMGNNFGRDFQRAIHKDLTVEAQEVHGWDKQIANGGRWLFQLNHKLDFLLFSTSNSYKSILAPRATNNKPGKYDYGGINIFGTVKVMGGGYLTAFESGITLSTLDFTQQSGQRRIQSRLNNEIEFGWYFEAAARWRYTHHNSTLEGLGIFGTWAPDEYDNEPENFYVINYANFKNQTIAEDQNNYARVPDEEDKMNRHVFFIDLKLNIRFRKMIIYYETTWITKEYDVAPSISYNDPTFTNLVNSADETYYSETVVNDLESFNKRKFYGLGNIGITWIIGE